MRLTILVVAVAVALGAAPRFSAAQSLAEIAAKEKERRKGTSGKVITESDLRSAGHGDQSFESEGSSDGDAPADGAQAAEGGAPEKAAGSTEKSDDQKQADRQAALQKEIDAERTHVEGMKKDLAAREVELNDPTFNGPGVISGRRTALLKYVDDAKEAIKTHEKQIEKLLADARHEGISVR